MLIEIGEIVAWHQIHLRCGGQTWDITQETTKPTKQPKRTSPTLRMPTSTAVRFEWCDMPAAMTIAAVMGA